MSNALISAFNKQFTSFLTQLSAILPDNAELKTFKNMIHLPLLHDKRFILSYFRDNVLAYKEYIKNKDEKFFLDMDFSFFPGVSSEDAKKTLEFKTLWKGDISDENKEHIWKYLYVLTRLCEKVYE